MIPVMLQEYSPGNGVKDTGVAVTGGQGTGQKAIANVQLMDNEGSPCLLSRPWAQCPASEVYLLSYPGMVF